MQRQSPPKHRHDGTSPLPLGMDWIPPPRNWASKDTVMAHDRYIGWCYFVTIPSWTSLAKSRDSEPVVFYRVFVGIQSPEGITTTRTLLRRFNDFLKLHDVIKRSFPNKIIPSTPSKGLLRMKTKGMLEERRISLEEWITKLLSDIELSRSVSVASFLELEAAARLSFQEDGKPNSDSHVYVNTLGFSTNAPQNSSLSVAGSSIVASENGSDTVYETSEFGSPSLGRDNISEVGTEDLAFYDDINSPIDKFLKYGISNIDEGLSIGQGILERIENFPKHKADHSVHNRSSIASEHGQGMLDFPSELNGDKTNLHFRKISNESIGSEKSSQRGNTLSSLALPNSNGRGLIELRSDTVVVKTTSAGDSDYKVTGDMHIVLPVAQRQMVNRIFETLQRKLINAKTDMEDLTSRLNQEIAVKNYLASKVKDLEVELETTKQKSKENLEHALFVERERITQMQWEMEELRQKSMEIELKSKSKQVQISEGQTIDLSNQKLNSAMQKYENLLKQHQETEGSLKSDIRILVKEVKSLRSTDAELKQQLNQLVKEKTEAEERVREEQKRNLEAKTRWRKLIRKCKLLHEEIQECDIKSSEGYNLLINNIPSVLDLVLALKDRIDEAEHLSEDDELWETQNNMLVENVMINKQENFDSSSDVM